MFMIAACWVVKYCRVVGGSGDEARGGRGDWRYLVREDIWDSDVGVELGGLFSLGWVVPSEGARGVMCVGLILLGAGFSS